MVNKYYQKHNEKFWKKHLKDIKIILKNKRRKKVKDWYKIFPIKIQKVSIWKNILLKHKNQLVGLFKDPRAIRLV